MEPKEKLKTAKYEKYASFIIIHSNLSTLFLYLKMYFKEFG